MTPKLFISPQEFPWRVIGTVKNSFGMLAIIVFSATPLLAQEFRNVTCEGSYDQHLQGVCADKESIYWSFTTTLVKTDLKGKILKSIPVAAHHGDLCIDDGKLCVAVNLGKFNDINGNADSWIYVYQARDLSFSAKHPVPEVIYGAGGVAVHDGRFLVVGGLPDGIKENLLYEFDAAFKLRKKHTLASGHTVKGIQTAAFADGHWWFGCYGEPKVLLKADAELKTVQRFEFDCSLGILPVGDGQFLVGRGASTKDQKRTGRLELAETDPKSGLKLIPVKK